MGLEEMYNTLKAKPDFGVIINLATTRVLNQPARFDVLDIGYAGFRIGLYDMGSSYSINSEGRIAPLEEVLELASLLDFENTTARHAFLSFLDKVRVLDERPVQAFKTKDSEWLPILESLVCSFAAIQASSEMYNSGYHL